MEDLKEMKEQQCFFIIEKSEETTFEFQQNSATVDWFRLCIIIETQKIANLLGDADNESSKLKMVCDQWSK